MADSPPHITGTVWTAALVVLLAGYLAWLSRSIEPYAGSADSSGYLWSGRLFRHTALSTPIAIPPRFPTDQVGVGVFVPLGARLKPGTLGLVPTYPTGLPRHLAAASLVAREETAVKAVLLFAAGGTLWLLYLLGRDAGLDRAWALAACLVMACSPLFLFIAVQPFSDVLATLWAEAAVLCAWRAGRRRAIAAGASLAIAVLVRPTSLLLVFAVAAALPIAPGAYAGLAAGALPFALFAAAYQTWAYGHPLASGYGDVSSAFSAAHAGASLVHYVAWLPRLASWIVVLAPAGFYAWRGTLARWRLIAAAWIGGIFGLYALYLLTAETWWYLRFVLPAIPPLVLAGVAGAQEIVCAIGRRGPNARFRRVASAAGFTVAVACAAALLRADEWHAHRSVKFDEQVYRDALKLMAIEMPLDAPVLMVQMTGAANYYAPRLRFLRFDHLTPTAWDAVRRWQARERIVIHAALFPFEQEQLFPGGRSTLPCDWRPRGHYRHVTFWECPPDRQEPADDR